VLFFINPVAGSGESFYNFFRTHEFELFIIATKASYQKQVELCVEMNRHLKQAASEFCKDQLDRGIQLSEDGFESCRQLWLISVLAIFIGSLFYLVLYFWRVKIMSFEKFKLKEQRDKFGIFNNFYKRTLKEQKAELFNGSCAA